MPQPPALAAAVRLRSVISSISKQRGIGLPKGQKFLFGGVGHGSKTPIRIDGHYIIEAAKVNADRFQMADPFIRKQAEKPDSLSITRCLYMFGVSRFGYYSWTNRQKDAYCSQAEKQERQNKLKELFRQIIRKLGFVPGMRTFRTYLWREFNVSISAKQAFLRDSRFSCLL